MLPDGWRSLYLGDVFSFKNGLNGEKSLYGAGAKFVNVMDVFRGPRLRHSEIVGEMAVSPRQLAEFAVKQGDVLFNRTSETDDEIALSTVYLDTAPAVFGGFVIRARPSGKALDQDFCIYGFQADSIRREMIRRGQGAIRSNIGQADLATVPILLPPLPEQRKIAAILSTWDSAIAALERLIANARAQKKALIQTLLPIGAVPPKKRLPGFSEDWKTARLGTLADLFAGGTPQTSRPDYWGGHVRWMSSGEINLREIHEVEGRITDVGLKNSSAKMVPVNSILIALAGQGTTRGKVAISRIPLCTNQSVAAVVPGPKLFADYLFHDLDARYDELRSMSLGDGGRGGLNLAVLRSVAIVTPTVEEQHAIASVLATAAADIRWHETQLATLRREKSALMQQLLTGKRRVKLEEAA
jgi:type I restriction enzyme S subunit